MPPPDRWDVYSPLGKVIPKTKLIAFKVPLKERLQETVDEKDQFSPSILMQRLKDQDHRLGLIVDLTFTHKYYDRQEFINADVMHKKILVKGHVIPSDEVFQEFVDAVKSCGEEDSVIGVHCTHGVNRTGYLICRYMIEELNIAPEEAISSFNEARGHNIERENYLQDLRSRKPGERRTSPEEAQAGGKKKERWRHHRDDHPGWRKNSGEAASHWGGHSHNRHDDRRNSRPHHQHMSHGRDQRFPEGRGQRFHEGRDQWFPENDPYANRLGAPGPLQNDFRNDSGGNQYRPYHHRGGRDIDNYYGREEQDRYQQAGWGTSQSRGGSWHRGGGGRGYHSEQHRSGDRRDNDRSRQAGWGHGARSYGSYRHPDGGHRENR